RVLLHASGRVLLRASGRVLLRTSGGVLLRAPGCVRLRGAVRLVLCSAGGVLLLRAGGSHDDALRGVRASPVDHHLLLPLKGGRRGPENGAWSVRIDHAFFRPRDRGQPWRSPATRPGASPSRRATLFGRGKCTGSGMGGARGAVLSRPFEATRFS